MKASKTLLVLDVGVLRLGYDVDMPCKIFLESDIELYVAGGTKSAATSVVFVVEF